MYDILIIGCGVTGAAAAFELSKYRLKVAVLEKENDVAEGATLEELLRRGTANGVPGLQILGAQEVKDVDSNLSTDVVSALWAPSAAICSPWEFCLALAETAVRNGTPPTAG